MAYMSQEKKAKIKVELAKVVPKDWKYSLSVHNHSSIVMTIKSAPIDFIGEFLKHHPKIEKLVSHINVNEYYPENTFSGHTLDVIKDILAALNTGNHNRSDIQTDYFDVGHFLDLNIGSWDKPFVVIK